MIKIPELAFGVILVLLFTLFAILLHKSVNRKDNPLAWADIITEHGSNKVSLSKIGMVVGIVVSSWAIVFITMQGKLTYDLFGIWLAFIGAVESYSKWLRSKTPEAKP